MKRIGLVCLGLALAANTANAQLTMQMSNGWTFSFAGNVNAFFTYENPSDDGQVSSPGALVPPAGDGATRGRNPRSVAAATRSSVRPAVTSRIRGMPISSITSSPPSCA